MNKRTLLTYKSVWPTSSNNMSNKKRELEEFLIECEKVKQTIDEEWARLGFDAQKRRDSRMWFQTLQHPGLVSRGDIIRRIFCILRYGGLFYRNLSELDLKKFQSHTEEGSKDSVADVEQNLQWKPWYNTTWPICTALSHGGRVIIQLPKKTALSEQIEPNTAYDLTFWRWLITGNPDGNLSKYITTSTSGEQCAQQNRLIFKRIATHGLALGGKFQSAVDEDETASTATPSSVEVEYKPLPFGKKKVIIEQKTSGLNARDTKIIGTDDSILRQHRHWGMNIPLGGENSIPQTGKVVATDGTNGHIYFYHFPPKNNSYGGIMIGVEGSEWSKYDVLGCYHGMSAKSSPYSPTYGYKWFNESNKSLKELGGPGKYDCMLVDLTDGWEFLIDKSRSSWYDEYCMHTSLPIPEDPLYQTVMTNAVQLLPKKFTKSTFRCRTRRLKGKIIERAKNVMNEPESDYSRMKFKMLVVRRKPFVWPPILTGASLEEIQKVI
jgi:hypothetical protein